MGSMPAQHVVHHALLSSDQIEQIFDRQRSEHDTFGHLAHSLFQADGLTVCDSLEHFTCEHCQGEVNLFEEVFQIASLGHIPAAEAWQHLVLPLRMEESTLVCATTRSNLHDAIEMLQDKLDVPFRVVFADWHLLEMFIAERYAYEGVDV